MANETATIKKQDPVIEKMTLAKNNLIARLPAGVDRDKFFLGILTAIQRSKATAQPGKSLADCDPNSVLLAAYDAAETGCSLSPSMQLGWLIPYGKECNFQPSYRFFIQKAFETGEVKAFFAEVVYADDKFDRQFAPKRNLFHAPGDPDKRTKDTAIGAYALVEFNDGMIEFEYMTAEQIDRHRKKSKQQNSMKWLDFWEEGWRITPIRVLSKRLPLKSRDFEKLIEMVNRDAENDLVISAEEILQPTVPREVPQEQKEQPKEQPKERPKDQPAQAATDAPKSEPATASNGSMFPADDQDPFLTPAEMQVFWEKTLMGANWKKSEVLQYLVQEFKVSQLKDLRRSQAQKAVEAITRARK